MDFTLDTQAGRPAYQQIESQVTDAIARGTLGPGDRLPPERDLALTLGVSRMTVRQAFDALARKGLVERGVGRGTFVTAPRVELDRTERVAGFSEQMARAGLEAGAVLVSAEVVRAPSSIARSLELEPGALVARIRRVRSGAGLPLTLEDSWLPDALFPGIIEQDLGGSLYALMGGETYGHAPVRAIERLEPVAARAADAQALGVRTRSPLMLVERVAYDARGAPVEFAQDRHRGDRARFVVEVTTSG
jgi:GntR family transcriptional regulator